MEYNLRCQTQFASKNLLLHYFSVNEFIYRSLRQKPQFRKIFERNFRAFLARRISNGLINRGSKIRDFHPSREVWASGSTNNFERVFAWNWNKFDIFPHEIIFETISFLKLLTNLPHRRNKKELQKAHSAAGAAKNTIWFARKRCGK